MTCPTGQEESKLRGHMLHLHKVPYTCICKIFRQQVWQTIMTPEGTINSYPRHLVVHGTKALAFNMSPDMIGRINMSYDSRNAKN
jgi:hypothetical protein